MFPLATKKASANRCCSDDKRDSFDVGTLPSRAKSHKSHLSLMGLSCPPHIGQQFNGLRIRASLEIHLK
jgi:hypothetical protein